MPPRQIASLRSLPTDGAVPYRCGITARLKSYVETGRTLNPDERAIAAQELQQIDEPDQTEIDAAWDGQIRRRVDDIAEGRITMVSGEESAARVRAQLAQLQQ